MEIFTLLIGLAIGLLSGIIFFLLKSKKLSSSFAQQIEEQKNFSSQLVVEKSKLEEKCSNIEGINKKLTEDLSTLRNKEIELNKINSSFLSDNKNLTSKLEEQKQELENLNQKLKIEFKNLANEIMEEKSKKFTEQNKQNLSDILNPLKEKIKDFEQTVKESHEKGIRQHSELKEKILSLTELNTQMSKEANNLTNALKGQTKTQGNWGEFILEQILERSGLVKDKEYFVQQTYRNTEGAMVRPDVIISLPEKRSIVIDSKVSLVAYEKYCSAEDEGTKQQALKEHMTSLRNHINGLSGKEYQNIPDLNTLDFVLLFMNIEPAFNLAMQTESTLFNEAFDKKIVIVSPSTLLATLLTIANIWKNEKQNKNALEIATLSGQLYDKFVGFVADMKDIDKKIKAVDSSYSNAMNKLSEGRGNIVRQAEKIKTLGAKVSKQIPQDLLDRSENFIEAEIENEEEEVANP
ncbi:MAG TPA: DNA recombination protein RmuC [Ignavibacteriaceae bacterium]|nr:DNA recombination protein RmuC [Ignavibacteriaceae bacterium]